MKKNKKYCILWIILLAYIFIAYIFVYYGKLNFKNFNNNLVVFVNIFLEIILQFINKFIDALLTEKNISIIIIAVVAVYTINKFNFKEIIQNLIGDLTSLEAGKVKVMFQHHNEIINKLNEEEKINIEELEQKESKDEIIKEKIQNSRTKMELLNILKDNPFLIYLLERIKNKKIGALKIPINKFKRNCSIEEVAQIFEYSVEEDFIKIIDIKKDKKDIMNDIYIQIKE